VLRVLDTQTAGDAAQSLLVLGAGGAARAAWAAARERGMILRVAARHPLAAREALQAIGISPAEIIPLAAPERLTSALALSSVVINATPVGMGDPHASPLPVDLLKHLPASALIFDMVYAPPDTALLRAARALGLRTVGGLDMLLEQGAAAFQLWTGQRAPIEVMRAALATSVIGDTSDAK
ncbi:MAG: shikimate dehydrogenase family protein, partial [Nitrososphaerota archaeon]